MLQQMMSHKSAAKADGRAGRQAVSAAIFITPAVCWCLHLSPGRQVVRLLAIAFVQQRRNRFRNAK